MFLQGWINRVWINESSFYGTWCIVLLKTLKMGLYFSEIDTRGWPYRRRDHTLPSNHTFTIHLPPKSTGNTQEAMAPSGHDWIFFYWDIKQSEMKRNKIK